MHSQALVHSQALRVSESQRRSKTKMARSRNVSLPLNSLGRIRRNGQREIERDRERDRKRVALLRAARRQKHVSDCNKTEAREEIETR